MTEAQEPTLIPKVRVYFADFLHLRCSNQPGAYNPGDLLRIRYEHDELIWTLDTHHFLCDFKIVPGDFNTTSLMV